MPRKKCPGAGTPGRELDGELDSPPNIPSEFSSTDLIRAEIVGDECASAFGYTVRSPSPVLALCRDLVEGGAFPHEPLEAWRGGILCLRIRSIGEAAGLEVSPHGVGFRKRPLREGGGGTVVNFGGSPCGVAAE